MSNVRVAVRARPILPREVDANSPIVVDMVGQSTRLFKSRTGVAVGQAKDASKEFVYDFSHWSVRPSDPHFVSQNKVFQDVGLEVLASAFKGYNTCIFAYGQTGSGKTYTMMGNESSPGLIPRICEELFARMSNTNQGQVSYRVEVSYMEIYNEKVRDLLQPVEHQRKGDQPALHTLKLREHPKDGPYVQDLSTHQVNDYTAILNLIHLGNRQRSTAFTKMNDLSSRSHAIFTIIFKQARYSEDLPSETVSKINLVDLAGSERASQTGAEGQRLRESGSINKSLVCLGNVISALAEMSSHPNKKHYIPYRDSILTWLLKDSLGGNSKTIMIATVSPCECSYGETLSTLRYASRAKNIINKPVVNEDNNVMLIRELRDEIRRLRDIIANGDMNVVPPESSLRLAVDLRNKERRIAALTKNWAEKWDSIHKIIEERELALHSEGVKMTVASERPHLLGLDEDMFGAGVVLYYLKNGKTTIGSEGSEPVTDISLKADDIEPLHCEIVLAETTTSLYSLHGACHVNRISVQPNVPTKLSHGDTLLLGSRTYLRFNHPQEAQKLKETSMQSADRSGLSDHDSSYDPLTSWSPLLTHSGYQQHEKLNQLEQERDTLQQQQSELVKDYEERIQSVLEQLKKEEAGKVALQEQLEQLQEQQMTASIRLLSFSASGEMKRPKIVTSTPRNNEEERSTLKPPPSPTPSKQSVASLSTREVMGQEDTDSPYRSPLPSDWVDCGGTLSPADEQTGAPPDLQQYCVSLTDKGGFMYVGDQESGMKSAKSEEYLLLESNLDRSLDYPGELRSRTLTSFQDNGRYDRRRLVSRREKVILRKKLYDAEEENVKMRKDLIDLEYRLHGQQRRRSYAFDDEDDLSYSTQTRSRSRSVGNASSASLKIVIPTSFLRGYGMISSYHVYEVHISVGGEKWRVCRKYQDFRDYHNEMAARYPQLSQLTVPPSKWVGFRNELFVAQRKVALERYLQSLVVILACVPGSPFSNSEEPITRETLQTSHRFFIPGHLEVDRCS